MTDSTQVARAAARPVGARAALRGGVVGNLVDNVHVFLPVVVLPPVLPLLAGPAATASTGAVVVMAVLLGRPVGGVVFGRISDRLGRTHTTRVAILGTALCALGIAVVPTHASIGVAAIGLVVALRVLSGAFVAGEYSAAIPLAMEWSPPRRRGLMSGLILSMAPWAQAAIAFGAATLLVVLGPQRYAAWGWRACFAAAAAASLGMWLYYRRRVVDAPSSGAQGDELAARRTGLWALVAGDQRSVFWPLFGLMSGLWLFTNVTVLLLPRRLATDSGLTPTQVSVVMGVAAVVQALVMAVAGHLSTVTGRRAFFVVGGLVGGVAGSLMWVVTTTSRTPVSIATAAALLQVVTVCVYGPVAAYLSEHFPAGSRSIGYGSAYSLSIVVPALHPFYLPSLERLLGHQGAVIGLLVLGGLLVAGCAAGGSRSQAGLLDDSDNLAAPAHVGLGRGMTVAVRG